jgi:hypothetical protein
MSLVQSPAIPFDASKKPGKGILKPTPVRSRVVRSLFQEFFSKRWNKIKNGYVCAAGLITVNIEICYRKYI